MYNNEWFNAFALVRPPGHHAVCHDEQIKGFCFLNNVAIAANILLAKGLQKILILDWDVHHGDSTSKIFYEDDRVLYISIHKHMNGNFYPEGDWGDSKNLGKNKGLGFNLNFPLNPLEENDFIGDSEYVYIFFRFIMPIIKEY